MSWADEERARQAGIAIAKTANANPDVSARANAVARNLGLPADVVERNLSDIENRQRTLDQARTVQSAPPKLQEWMADPRNAAAAGSDLNGMKSIAATTQPFTPDGPTPTFGNYISGLWHSFALGLKQNASGMMQQVLDFSPSLPSGDPRGFAIRQGRDGPIVSFSPQVRQQTTQYARGVYSRADADVQKTTPDFKTWWGSGIYQGVSSFVQQAPALAMSLLTKNPAFALGQAGVQQETQAYAGYRAGGAGRGAAMAGSLGQGATEIGTEFLPLGHYVNAFTGMGKGFAKELGLSFLEEQVGEQAATHIENALDTALTPNKTWQQYRDQFGENALNTAVATLTQSVIGGALPTAAHLMRQHAETQIGSTLMDQVMGDAALVKQRESDPEGFRQYVEHLTQNTPLENVYIPAEAITALHQDGVEDHPFWGKFADQIDEANALGGDVVVPFSEAATHLAGTPEWESLKGEARFSPGGMSQAELATLEQHYKDQAGTLQERMSQEADSAAKAAEPAAQVYQDVYGKLIAAGQTPRVASQHATLWAAQREATGARMGVDALTYHQQNPIEFRNAALETPSEGRVLNEGQSLAPIKLSGFKARVPDFEIGDANPLNDQERIIDGGGVTVRPFGDRWRISDLRSVERGGGRRALQRVIAEADSQGLPLELSASPTSATAGKTMTKTALRKWYQGFGFDGPADRMVRQPQGDAGNARGLEQARDRSGRAASGRYAPLVGSPEVAGSTGPIPDLVDAAEAYAQEAGIDYSRQANYVEIDPEFSKRIADAYEAMEHAPDDTAVRHAYADLKRQTRAQYDAITKAGYTFTFFDDGSDPYDGNPWNSMRDIRANKHMAVYSTAAGYGSGYSDIDIRDNPMLEDTGVVWKDQAGVEHPVLANDLFRAVHDVFGHGLEGAGFRARGEENAWQAHARLFTGPALAALTTETRGQNSWLNFGPNGEMNQDALLADTTFADQKTGLLPSWAWSDRKAAPTPAPILYHGTPYEFDMFASPTGKAVWFSEDRRLADQYANGRRVRKATEGRIVEATLAAKNPLNVPQDGNEEVPDAVAWAKDIFGFDLKAHGWERSPGSESVHSIVRTSAFANAARAAGHDAIAMQEGGKQTWGALDKNSVSDPGTGRVLYQQVFYSALERAAEGISAMRAPAAQWIATLKKSPGVKDEELEWTGILDWLAMQPGPVEKDAVLQVIRDGGIKVEEAVLGNMSDEEKLAQYGLTLEDTDSEDYEAILSDDGIGTQFSNYSSDPSNDTYHELLITLPQGQGGNPSRAPSTHWQQEAVVAHTRFMDKAGPNGEKILFVEEVQSDWHQKGREQGYEEPVDPATVEKAQQAYDDAKAEYTTRQEASRKAADDALPAITAVVEPVMRRMEAEGARPEEVFKYFGGINLQIMHPRALLRAYRSAMAHVAPDERTAAHAEAIKKAEALSDAIRDEDENSGTVSLRGRELDIAKGLITNGGVPNAPFKASWPALVMKRLTAWAAQNGYDQVAWTTGEQQAERYNLSQAVGSLTLEGMHDSEGYRIRMAASPAVQLADNGMGQVVEHGHGDSTLRMTESQMREAFGDDITKRLIESDGEPLRGEDLRVGGEGMKAFYDRNLVNITNKIIKKYGAKVEEVKVKGENPQRAGLVNALQRYAGLSAYGIGSRAEAEARIAEWQGMIDRGEGDTAKAAQWQGQLMASLPLIDRIERMDKEPGVPQPGFTITPELRDAAKEGFALFQGGNQPRGRVSGGLISGQAGPTIIELFEKSDLSTIIHETGHVWTEELRRNALDPKAPQDVKDDWQAVQDWWAAQGHALAPDGSIPTEAHELFARGFERYAMEGKSPSSALRRVFDAFRSWLLTIYKHVDNLNSPITPEIRRVFDRMVATQDEIDAASDRQGVQDRFKNAEEAGMTTAEFAAYRKLADDARTEAFDALLYRTMAAIRRERTQAYKAEAERVRDGVTAEVNATPVFRAAHLLRTGRFLDDPEREAMPMKLDEAWLKDRFGEDALASLPRGVPPIYRENGDDADTIAEVAGFSTGEEMVNALIAMEAAHRTAREGGDKRSARARAIETETQARMEQRHGDPLNDGSIEDEALAAVHNNLQGELIASEARQLGRQTKRQPTPLQHIREWAAEKINAGKVVDVASKSALQRYARAEAKAGKAFVEALAKGDKDEAFKQSEIRLINHALIAEAKKAADFVEAAVDRLGKIAKTKTRKSLAQDYLDRAHALLEKFEFRPRSQKTLDEAESFAAYAVRKAAEGVDVAVPPRLEQDGVHYTRMSVQELRGLNDAVMQLIHLGRKKQRLIDDKDRRDYQEARDLMLATARHNVHLLPTDPNIETKGIRVRKFFAGAHAAFTKMGRMIDMLDGGDVRGPFNRYIWRPIAEAHNRFNDIMERVQQEWKDTLDAVPDGIKKRFAERVSIPEMPGLGGDTTWSRMQLHQMARNAGTAENWRILAEGRGWDADAAFAALDREMTAEEWAYVQRDLDTVGSFWPEIKALYERVNGIAPPQVTPRPISTRHGTFPGGYYPLVPDRTANPKLEAAIRSDELFNTLYTRATTRNGFINERTGATYVISLTPGISQRHITEVVHDFTHREAVMQADRFLSDPQVMTVMRETIGPEMQGQFRPWLKFIANQWASDQSGNQALENIANKSRTAMSIMGMGFRLSTMLTQVAGYGNSIEALGTNAEKWILSGGKTIAGMGWPAAYRFAAERSGVIRHRLQNVDRTQEQELAKLEGKTGLLADVRRFAYYGVGIMDHVVVLPTWHAGYNKAIAEGMEEDDAVTYADKIVENSQGGAGALNTSAVQRNKGMASLLVMFYSYGAAYYNRQAQLGRDIRDTVRTRKTSNLPRLMARSFWLLFAPNVLVGLIHAALGGGPKDDESYAAYIAADAFGGLFTGLPIIGGAVQSLVSGYDFQASPLDRAVTTGTHFLQDLWHSVDDYVPASLPGADLDQQTHASKKAVKNAVDTAGYITALPLGQFSNAVQFTTDWANGTEDPQSVGDWLKGLQRGKIEQQ